MKRLLKAIAHFFFRLLGSKKPYVLVAYAETASAYETALRHALVLRLQRRYGVCELPVLPTDRYSDLHQAVQRLKWRYPRLQHSLLLGMGTREAYWVLCLEHLPRVGVWLETDNSEVPLEAHEIMFWAQGGVMPPGLNAQLQERFPARSLAVWHSANPLDWDVDQWQQLLDQAQAQQQQERQEQQIIDASGLFEPRYFTTEYEPQWPDWYYVQHYVRRWHNDFEPRKPYPGFHPTMYAAQQGLSLEVEPFAHYLAQQRPTGPWLRPVVPEKVALPDALPTMALHIHAYYVDMLPELIARLEHNVLRPDLFISVGSEDDARLAESVTASYAAAVQVRTVPNRGRDIGPMLTEFGTALLAYDLIGHIHTKQSLHVPRRDTVTAWQAFLLDALVGGTAEQGGARMDACLAQMMAEPALQIVYPDDPVLLAWDANYPYAHELAPSLGLEALPQAFNFPVGTMFWLRKALLQRFVDVGLNWEDYPAEPLPKDGTMLHALERLFGVVPLVLEQPYALAWATGRSR